MDKNLRVGRMVALVIVIVFIFIIFVLQLMQLQIVHGSEYANEVQKGSTVKFNMAAARGEILDKNGVALVANRTGYNIQFHYAFLDKKEQNDIILELTTLLTQRNEEWLDTLPITKTEPFEFITDNQKETDQLKVNLEIQQYATMENVINGLIERFEISDEYTPKQMRIIAGVRYEMLKNGFGIGIPFTFAKDISQDTMIIINENSKAWPGVVTIESNIRDNAGGSVAPHIIGNIGPLYKEEYDIILKDQKGKEDDGRNYYMNDEIGKSGIEDVYEEYLRGTRGTANIDFDASGKAIGDTYQVSKEPIPGHSVKLTFDAELQQLAYDSLAKQIKYLQENEAEGQGKEADVGAVVALEVKTGNILAAATYPSYDITKYRTDYTELLNDPLNPLFNRAIDGVYTPGSTYKPVLSLAGLTEGTFTDESTYLCTGVFHYLGYSPKCLGYHGNATVLTALQKSCNIFYYNAGLDLGIDKINEYATSLGLGLKTGYEMGGAIGHLASPEYAKARNLVWNPGDVVQASIGQSYNAFSVLQLANYTATIARDGVLMETHIVDSVVSYNGDDVIMKTEPVVISEMKNQNRAFEIVKEGMHMASVSGGTSAKTFGNYPIPVASKTGTPQKGEELNSVYICFAPIDDPKIAVAVVIENGYHGYTGAPVARDIFNAYFFDDFDIYN